MFESYLRSHDLKPAGDKLQRAFFIPGVRIGYYLNKSTRIAHSGSLGAKVKMSKSITQETMTRASRETAKRLASAGFKRKGIHLHRKIGELFHAIQFQASQWGTAAEGKFTVNLIVTSSSLYTQWIGRPFPANPASALFPIQMRIGSLIPQRCDRWWPVDSETDISSLAIEVASTVEQYAMQFFMLYESNELLLAQLRQRNCPGCTTPLAAVVHALVANNLGYHTEAVEACQRALSESNVPAFSERVISLAQTLGLPVT